MTILELREKRNKAWEAAKAFVETKRDKDGLLSAEDAATYAEMEQKVQNYTAEIARMEEMEAMEAELNKPVNTPITNRPMGGANPQEKKTGRASNEYKKAMLHAIRNNFRNIRNVLYNCAASRPGIEGKTNEDTREVQTDVEDFNCCK